ncbi:MAG: hypothetical protein ACO3EK_19275, partial [Alphaproteobacteria bacterium]
MENWREGRAIFDATMILGREPLGSRALNGALVVFAQMPVARLVARMGTRRALVTSSVLYGLAYASVGLAAT